jgi:ParB/RepB/Spo0J family partition protein
MDEVHIDLIKPSPYQLRLSFKVEDLKEEIQRDGLLSPLTVRRKNGYYELIDGQRRLEALKELGWEKVAVEVQEADDRKARLMVYKLNSIRESYTVEERAKYFKKLADEGMLAYQIGKELSIDDSWVRAHLNIFNFPQEVQNAVWEGELTLSQIRELEPFIGANIEEATKIAKELILRKIKKLDETRKLLKPRMEEIEKARIEAARKALGAAAPISIKLETPEEFEKAAMALREEAKKRREEVLTSEERAELEAEKRRKEEERRKREQERRKREEEERRRIEEDAKKRAKDFEEAEKQRIEEEAKEKAKKELLEDTEFIRKIAEKEFLKQRPLEIEAPLQTMDLEDVVIQKLGTSIPADKIPRAKEIVKEEIRSLQKRLEIFPEKSAKIEPKFEYLKLMETRGVIPYTIWDFQYRDDYAGDKDFHGNCSPQVVEQCIWRFTNERDLVLDPMAGSGTTIDVCKRYNRKCLGYDIKPPSNRTDIIQNDSRKIPLDNESIDMIFIHPPYWNLTYFTKAEERLPDLSRAKTLEEFLGMLKQVFQECYRTLRREKFMCVLLGDLIREGKFVPLCEEATKIAEEVGFINYGYAVKLAHGEVSRKKSGVIVAEPMYTYNLKISHDLVMFFRKPDHDGN